jgi:hypothetical protein
MRFTVIAILIIMFLTGCNRQPGQEQTTAVSENVIQDESQQAFFDHLKSFCGQSFEGRQLYRSPHGDSWEGRKMIIHVTICEQDQVHIPFHVDNDHSRTWMFMADDGRLVFRHQHLHEDGTPEDSSLYGGWANLDGNALVQYFPADDYTASVIEGAIDNLWIVSFNEQLSTLTYRLDRAGEKRLEIQFDLLNPLQN